MVIVQILIALLLLYLILVFAPAILMYKIIFGRKDRPKLPESDLSKTYYAPFADRLLDSYQFLHTIKAEEVTLRTPDGLTLRGEYRGGGFEKTVIFFHGYGGTPYHQFSPQAEQLYKAGFNLLFPVQRGHNESEGDHTTLGITEASDLLLWIGWAKSRLECKEILLYGISMGCSAIEYAGGDLSEEKIRAMILDCGFTSPYDQLMFDAKKHHLPGKLFLPYIGFWARRFLSIDIKRDTRPSLAKTAIPALFFHGTEDETVPLSQGLANFEACGSEKELCVIEGAGHTLCYLYGGEEAALKLDTFIRKYFR